MPYFDEKYSAQRSRPNNIIYGGGYWGNFGGNGHGCGAHNNYGANGHGCGNGMAGVGDCNGDGLGNGYPGGYGLRVTHGDGYGNGYYKYNKR